MKKMNPFFKKKRKKINRKPQEKQIYPWRNFDPSFLLWDEDEEPEAHGCFRCRCEEPLCINHIYSITANAEFR